MQPLLDADVLRYEIGFAAETTWKGRHPDATKEWLADNPPPWDIVEELLENRIANICGVVEATQPPIFFFTGKTNFRNEIAKKKKYKDRPSKKPFHFYNITAYIKGKYEYRESEGLEADDLMAIEQTARGGETIICTRDKDLRSVSGWHYGWELGNQPQFGPLCVTGLGKIRLSDKRDEIKGYGLLFFLAQCLTGDTVDSVPGLPNCGPVAAFNLLEGTQTYEEGLERVKDAYRKFYDVQWAGELLEQGRLLWMTRKINEDGSPELWSFE